MTDHHAYLEFEVSLRHIKPRIFRCFLLHRTATFLELHQAIQGAGPWSNYDLFAFYPNATAKQPFAVSPCRRTTSRQMGHWLPLSVCWITSVPPPTSVSTAM